MSVIKNGTEFQSLEISYEGLTRLEVIEQMDLMNLGTITLKDGGKSFIIDTGQRQVSDDGFTISVEIIEHSDADQHPQDLENFYQRMDVAEVHIGGEGEPADEISLICKNNGCTMCIELT